MFEFKVYRDGEYITTINAFKKSSQRPFDFEYVEGVQVGDVLENNEDDLLLVLSNDNRPGEIRDGLRLRLIRQD